MTKEGLQKSADRVKLVAFSILLIDVILIFWGIARTILIAIPSSTVTIADGIGRLLGLSERNAIQVYYAIIGVFAIPPNYEGYSSFASVLVGAFITTAVVLFFAAASFTLNMMANYVLAKSK